MYSIYLFAYLLIIFYYYHHHYFGFFLSHFVFQNIGIIVMHKAFIYDMHHKTYGDHKDHEDGIFTFSLLWYKSLDKVIS